MGALNLTNAMDGAAAAFLNVTGVVRSFGYPNEDQHVGDVYVDFPEGDIEIATHFGRGSDSLTLPVYFICGMVQDKASRDAASAAIADVLDADGTWSGAVQVASAARCSLGRLAIQGVQHLVVRFEVEVTS
jgi:hypothetical protein